MKKFSVLAAIAVSTVNFGNADIEADSGAANATAINFFSAEVLA